MSESGTPGPIGRVAAELTRTLADVDAAEFDAFVAELRVPGRAWFCTGQGRSGLVARMAAMRLMHLGHRTHVVGEATAPSIGDGDVLLVLSASGSTPASLHLAGIARDVSASVVLVTATVPSPLGEVADTTLRIPAQASVQFGGSLFEQAALLTLDAAVLALDAGEAATRGAMHRRHTNLQ